MHLLLHAATRQAHGLSLSILGERPAIVKFPKSEHLGVISSILDYNFVQFFLYKLNVQI